MEASNNFASITLTVKNTSGGDEEHFINTNNCPSSHFEAVDDSNDELACLNADTEVEE